MSERFYLLRIQLLDIEPKIWRRFVVPANITMDRLHDVIQIVMGWTDSHLPEFTIGNKRYTEYPESKEDGLVCGRYRLGDLIKQKGRTFKYLYDFGDSWEHKLEIGQITDPVPGDFYPRLTDIAGRCPPEDVGGFPGYEEFIEAMANPKHPEHAHLKDWYGGPFDPNTPPADELRLEVLRLAKRWKPKKAVN